MQIFPMRTNIVDVKNEVTLKALENTTARLRALLRLNVTASLMMSLLIVFAAQDIARKAEQRASLDRAFDNLELSNLQDTWSADAAVLRRYWDEYDLDELDRAAKLAFLVTTASSFIAVNLKENGKDSTTANETASVLGKLAQSINGLRLSYSKLHVAADSGLSIQEFQHDDWRAYRDFLVFEENLESWATQWTLLCTTAAALHHLSTEVMKAKPPAEGQLARLVIFGPNRELLAWGSEQLIRRSDAVGDFVAVSELYPDDAFARAFFQLVRSSEGPSSKDFRTLRDYGLAYIWPRNSAEHVTADRIEDVVLDTLSNQRVSTIAELERKRHAAEKDNHDAQTRYLIEIPVFEAQWPLQNSVPILLLINLYLLVLLVTRRRDFQQQLATLMESGIFINVLPMSWPYSPLASATKKVDWLRALADGVGLLGLFYCAIFVILTIHLGWAPYQSGALLLAGHMGAAVVVSKMWYWHPSDRSSLG